MGPDEPGEKRIPQGSEGAEPQGVIAENTGEPAEQPASSLPRFPRWMTWGFGIGVLLTVFVCGGLGNWLMHAVMDAEAGRWINQYKDHEQVQEVLGGIESGGYDLAGTYREADEETVVYFVQGPKGTGQLVVTEFGMKVPKVELRSEGKSWILNPGERAAPGASHE